MITAPQASLREAAQNGIVFNTDDNRFYSVRPLTAEEFAAANGIVTVLPIARSEAEALWIRALDLLQETRDHTRSILLIAESLAPRTAPALAP